MCRQDVAHIPIHEIIFSTLDKPKLLSQVGKPLSLSLRLLITLFLHTFPFTVKLFGLYLHYTDKKEGALFKFLLNN